MSAPNVTVRERPILMSVPLIAPTMAGFKWQTRRVAMVRSCGVLVPALSSDPKPDIARCPYGQPGDRLWVREAWQVDAPRDGTWPDVEFYGCRNAPLDLIPPRFRRPEYTLYRATWDGPGLRWRPSIHMPRWASRITLEITDVRVQRVQEISEEDAKAEGVFALSDTVKQDVARQCAAEGRAECGACDYFARLWDWINLPRGYGWDANPWVWCLSFRRIA